jgi:putative acetyltransferase
LKIRKTAPSDLDAVLELETRAFGNQHGPEIADLVIQLTADPTAKPMLSLLAEESGRPVGHILFTSVRIAEAESPISAAILAPLAVVPEAQKMGIGGRLIDEGLRLLSESGVCLVFVLGHPDYYPRQGFKPAGILGFDAPYPIAEKNADAWMILELRPGVIGRVKGRVLCAEALDRPEHWRE